jgi:hypothetical protein
LIAYWLLFAFFAAGAMFAPPTRLRVQEMPDGTIRKSGLMPFHYLFLAGALATILLIGLRYHVGGDWSSYLGIFRRIGRYSFSSALGLGDPGYQLFNWVANHLGLQIWSVNMVAAAFFGWGLYRLCSVQPSPWLAFAIAVPYMVVVVAMGYTRQSMALGVLMAGLARQTRGGSILSFAIYVALAATFHKTAVVMFPIVAISSRGNRLVNLLTLIFTSIWLYSLFLGDAMKGFLTSYIDAGYDSQGAGIRIAMNMVPALLLWVFGNKFGFERDEHRTWRNFSFAALAGTVFLVVLPSSTAVDRVSVYLMPLQIAVLTRAALLSRSRLPGTAAVLAYSFAVQFVWLNFAAHARYWVPYQFYPL